MLFALLNHTAEFIPSIWSVKATNCALAAYLYMLEVNEFLTSSSAFSNLLIIGVNQG